MILIMCSSSSSTTSLWRSYNFCSGWTVGNVATRIWWWRRQRWFWSSFSKKGNQIVFFGAAFAHRALFGLWEIVEPFVKTRPAKEVAAEGHYWIYRHLVADAAVEVVTSTHIVVTTRINRAITFGFKTNSNSLCVHVHVNFCEAKFRSLYFQILQTNMVGMIFSTTKQYHVKFI